MIELDAIYNNRYHAKVLKRKSEIWRIIVKNFYMKFINKDYVVIDVASGHGEFVNNINCKRKIAVDLKSDGSKYLNSDVEFYSQSALNIEKIGKKFADVVFVSNFLEHLESRDVLLKFFIQVKTVLKDDGKFLIVGPNLRYLPGKYWDYFDHYLGLTHLSLCEALELSGFEIEICLDKFLPHADKESKLPNPFFAWLYMKIPFLWRIFGKQFFIVCSKNKTRRSFNG